jgi:hypothetical protein
MRVRRPLFIKTLHLAKEVADYVLVASAKLSLSTLIIFLRLKP